jgi:hypothetical protein
MVEDVVVDENGVVIRVATAIYPPESEVRRGRDKVDV